MKKDRILQLTELLILMIVLLLLHSQVGLNTEDDNIFRELYKPYKSLSQFLADRYEGWSSRILIEAVLIPLLLVNDWVWRILNTLVIVLAVYAIAEITLPDGKKQHTWLPAISVFFVSTKAMSSAGFGATTLNYVWPLAFGLWALIPIAKTLQKINCSFIYKVTGVIAAIFACNQEQMALIILGVCVYTFIEKIIKKQKQEVYGILLMAISLGLLIFEMTCPGNKIRSTSEVNFFKEYLEYGFIDKLELGFLNLFAYYFGMVEKNISIVFLLVAMAISGIRQKNRRVMLTTIPGTLLFLYYFFVVEGFMKNEKETKTITLFQNSYPSKFIAYSSGKVVIEIIGYLLILILLGIGVYHLMGKGRKAFLCNLILLAGFLSRFILGFSASVILSSYRTTLFCTVATFIVGIFLIEPLLPELHKKKNELH